MQNDEQSIRELVAEWQKAAAAGDLSKLLDLMAEDVCGGVQSRRAAGSHRIDRNDRRDPRYR